MKTEADVTRSTMHFNTETRIIPTLMIRRWRMLVRCMAILALFLLQLTVVRTEAGEMSLTGSLITKRHDHTATRLKNGMVLVAGGHDGFSLDSAELYDPATGTFTATGRMITTRENHTATLLNNGKVLIAGGYKDGVYLPSAELYDPATGAFVATGDMLSNRSNHTATLLPDGSVLITGGSTYESSHSSAERYDPATGTFVATGSMTTARTRHTATLLPGGDVLIAGGALTNAEIYSPATGLFTATGAMVTAHSGHTATVLPGGQVLLAGGPDSVSAELYEPATGTFASTGSMTTKREGHAAVLLPDGNVLIAGGEEWDVTASTETYYPQTGSFSATGRMAAARSHLSATLLANGSVLIAGGYKDDGDSLSSAELYDSGVNLDLTPPETTITSQPANLTNAAVATFTFSADEPNATFECKLDGGEYASCSSPQTYSNLTPATHTVTVRAIDQARNVDPTPAISTWTIDMTAPVTTASPGGGTYTPANAPKTVTLAANETATIYYTTDGSEPTMASSRYDQPLSFSGTTTVRFFAVDPAGNREAVKTESYTIDDPPQEGQPVVVLISMLPDGAVTNYDTCNISGTVSDVGAIKSITINGTVVVINPDGTFSHVLRLQEGPNTIMIVIVDQADHALTETRTITYDPTSPALAISSPPDNSMSNRSVIDVTGIVEEHASVSIAVNAGQPQFASINGTAFTASVELVPGLNTIIVTATNLAGATTTLKRSVTYDSEKPELAVTEPDQDIATTQEKIILKGRVGDDRTAVTITISVDGQSYTPPVVNGLFQQLIGFAAEKTYEITVTAADAAGNTAFVRRNIIYSKLINDGPPSLTVMDALNAYRIALGITEATDTQKTQYDLAPLGDDSKPQGNDRIDAGDVTVIIWNIIGLLAW